MMIAASILIAILAMCVRYALGFGFSLVFVPVATNIMSFEDAVTTTIVCELGVSALLVAELWKDIPWLSALTMKAGAIVGVLLGTALVARIAPVVLVTFAMAAVIGTGLLLLQQKFTIRITTWRSIVAGTLSGMLNAIAGLAGPPVVFLYYASTTSDHATRAALTGYFLPVYVLTAAARIGTGQMPIATILNALPCAVAAMIALRLLRPHLKKESRYLRPLALILIVVAAAGVLYEKVLKQTVPHAREAETRSYDNTMEIPQSNARLLRGRVAGETARTPSTRV